MKKIIASAKAFLILGVVAQLYAMQPQKPAENIWRAASRGDYNAVVWWLTNVKKYKENPSMPDNANGMSPLGWAAMKGHTNIVNLLLSKGASPHAVDNNKQAILHHAVKSGNPEIVRLILTYGANSNMADTVKGRTALQWLMRSLISSVVHVDLEKQAINTFGQLQNALPEAIAQMKDKQKRSRISIEQAIPVIEVLRAYGADPQIPDIEGKTIEWYINNVQILTESARQVLLRALGLPITPSLVQDPVTLQTIVNNLKDLQQILSAFDGGSKVQKLIWAIQVAQQEKSLQRIMDILWVSLSLLYQVNEENKETFKYDNDLLNQFLAVTGRIRRNIIDYVVNIKELRSTPEERMSFARSVIPAPAAQVPPSIKRATPEQPIRVAMQPVTYEQPRVAVPESRITQVTNNSKLPISLSYMYRQERKSDREFAPGESLFIPYPLMITQQHPVMVYIEGLRDWYKISISPDGKKLLVEDPTEIVEWPLMDSLSLIIDENNNLVLEQYHV